MEGGLEEEGGGIDGGRDVAEGGLDNPPAVTGGGGPDGGLEETKFMLLWKKRRQYIKDAER